MRDCSPESKPSFGRLPLDESVDDGHRSFLVQNFATEAANQDDPGSPKERTEVPEKAKEKQPHPFGRLSNMQLFGVGLALSAASFTAGRYFGSNHSVSKDTDETVSQLVSKDIDLYKILLSVDQALSYAKSHLFENKVKELENPQSGYYTYIFEFKGFGENKLIVLRGVPAGAERERLLKGLSALGYFINAGNSAANEGSHISKAERVQALLSVGLTTLLFGFFGFEMMRARKLKGLEKLSEKPTERLSDVGGLGHVVSDFEELAADIKAMTRGEKVSGVPKGILLVGGPGTGKTLSARALAGEVEGQFMCINPSSLASSRWAGDWAKSVLRTYKEARRLRDQETKKLRAKSGATGKEEAVVIIFLDEFDSVGLARGGDQNDISGVNHERRKMLNALLAEMDHVDPKRNKNIIIMGATNALAVLDPALLRPGRFSKIIELPVPQSVSQRLDILQKLSKRIVTEEGLSFADAESLRYIAGITAQHTGDELREILSQAVSLARRENTEVITDKHLLEAFQRRNFGRPSQDNFSVEKRALVACHEHGHALGAIACGIEPFLVSMTPRGNSGGRVIVNPDALPQTPVSLREMLRSVLYTAGGRGAELERYPGEFTDGAASDLQQIRTVVRHALSHGMLGNHYAMDLSEVRPEDMPAEIVAEMNQVAGLAVETAQKIVAAVGKETLCRLIEDSLAMKEELVGKAAVDFYATRLPVETIGEMRKIAGEFLKNPRRA